MHTWVGASLVQKTRVLWSSRCGGSCPDGTSGNSQTGTFAVLSLLDSESEEDVIAESVKGDGWDFPGAEV